MAYFQIAIDGPAGAGKSTIAKELAKILNYTYIDTGAMYRGITYLALEKGVDLTDTKEIIAIVKKSNLYFVNDDIFINDVNRSTEVRSQMISNKVSFIAQIPQVRDILVELQKKIAQNQNVVMDGRDIGTHVLPNAQVKIFLTASVEERAKRRYKELIAKGKNVKLQEILKDIQIRDKMDEEREYAPLLMAIDAVKIDTTGKSIEEVIKDIVVVIKEKLD